MNTSEMILELLEDGKLRTATTIANVLDCKVSSVSSLLKKMCDSGLLMRCKGVGPRGGYGYVVA